jgi:hypothetical protein
MNARAAVLIALAALPVLAHGFVKCQDAGQRVTYQDGSCPAGSHPVSASQEGISVIGKSPGTRQQEESFLRSRAATERADQTRQSRERQEATLAERERRSTCASLSLERRELDTTMRQSDAWQTMTALQARRRGLLDQLAQNGCL